MPVEFTKTNDQIVDFGIPAALNNLDQKTVMFWFNLDAWAAETQYRLIDKSGGSGNGWVLDLSNGQGTGLTRQFKFVHTFDDTNGAWTLNTDVLVAGIDYHLAITYDRTSVTNDPIIYVNGVSVAINETFTPVGTTNDDSAESFAIGNNAGTGILPMDGPIGDVRVYDTILSAKIIQGIADSKTFRLGAPFPIWRIKCIGATGLQVYDGVALGGTNYIIDDIAGVQGTPTGNPVGRADILLAYSG